MSQYLYQKSTARLTLQPFLTYIVKVDGRVVFFSEDYQNALDYVLAWRAHHDDKKRIRMDLDVQEECKQVNSTDGTEVASFC